MPFFILYFNKFYKIVNIKLVQNDFFIYYFDLMVYMYIYYKTLRKNF
jgi:hypothetical protein